VQLHPNDKRWGKEVELLTTHKMIGMGEWDEGGNQQYQFEHIMKRGDIVLVKLAGQIIALTEVVGDYEYNSDVDDLLWFQRRRLVRILDWYKIEYNLYVPPRGTLTRCDMNNNTRTNKSIQKWYKMILEKENMDEYIGILKNLKPQIILQGPPGTGKTRLAKMIAKVLTAPKDKESPIQKIDEFFKSFDDKKPEVIKRREESARLLQTFYQKFPKNEIKNLTLESYTIGTGRNDSFCWWIERGLKSLGYYFPGTARSYMIYWSKEKEEYSTHYSHSRLLSEAADLKDSMSKLAGILSELVLTKNSEEGFKILGESLILKILNTYHPDEYFPVNSVSCLNNILKLFKVDYSKLNSVEKNLRVQEIFNDKRKTLNPNVTNQDFMLFLFDNFNLKGELSVIEEVEVGVGEYKFIQFHPAYSYEDFVRGITAKTNAASQVEYKVENKILADFAQRALDDPSANYVLIIDEINRANLPAVLGELIYALEYRFDPEDPNDTTVESMYSIADPDGTTESFEEGKSLKLPQNLFIIGTMNTADRSVGHIDYAIRRRFAFVDMLPTIEPLKPFAFQHFKKISELFIKEFDTIDWNNPKLKRSDYLASDFRPEDVWIGHSYFIADDEEQLSKKLKYEVLPILKEYLNDGILMDSAKELIYGIS